MKFKLQEARLNEEAYFKVEYPDSEGTNYFYMVASSVQDAKDKILNREKHEKHEIYNNTGFPDYKYYQKHPEAVELLKFDDAGIDELKREPHKVYVSSHRTLRRRSHNKLNPDNKSEWLVHHLDGNEFNSEESNLLGIRNTSGDYRIASAIHKMLHKAGEVANIQDIRSLDYRHDCKVWDGSAFVDAEICLKFDVKPKK